MATGFRRWIVSARLAEGRSFLAWPLVSCKWLDGGYSSGRERKAAGKAHFRAARFQETGWPEGRFSKGDSRDYSRSNEAAGPTSVQKSEPRQMEKPHSFSGVRLFGIFLHGDGDLEFAGKENRSAPRVCGARFRPLGVRMNLPPTRLRRASSH